MVRAEGLPLQLAIFFAVNPEEELTAQDMSVKWGVEPRSILSRLHSLVKRGLLSSSVDEDDARRRIYTAGPWLLQVLGHA